MLSHGAGGFLSAVILACLARTGSCCRSLRHRPRPRLLSESAAGGTLMDETGTTAIGKLSGGSEVEILAWRPRGAEGTRYRVRATRNALEGWLGVASLSSPAKPSALVRRIAAAAPPVPAL